MLSHQIPGAMPAYGGADTICRPGDHSRRRSSLTLWKQTASLISAFALLCVLLIGGTGNALAASGTPVSKWLINPDNGPVYTSFVQDTAHVQNGTYAGKATAAAGTLMVHAMSFDPVDLSAYAQGYIHMVLYVEDASGFDSYAYFEIASGGENNVEEMEYEMQPVGFQDGWNHFTFKLSDGAPTGGDIRWSSVNWSRIVLQNNGGEAVWIDGVYVTMNANDPAPASSAVSKWLINPDNGPIYTSFVQDTAHVQNGTYAGKATAAAGTLMVHAMSFDPVDLSAYTQGYIHMVLYVEDASGFDSYAYFEIASGGENNVEEMEYEMQPVGFQDGWNHFTFKLSDGAPTGGDIRWSSVNWSRIVLQNNGGEAVWIDGVYVTMNQNDPAPASSAVPPEGTLPDYDKDFTPVLRFGVMSDVHISASSTKQDELLTKAIRKLYQFAQSNPRYTALDAVCFSGDSVDRAKTVEYQRFTALLEKEIQEGTEVVACMGNHEFLLGGALSGEAGDPVERWESYMGHKADYAVSIKGFSFIALSGSVNGVELAADSQAFLTRSLENAAASKKPVFVFHHAALSDTIASAYDAVLEGANGAAVKQILSAYPQVLEFTGHSHYPLNDARNIYQEAFTSIGASTLQATVFNDSYIPADPTPQMMIVEVNANNVVRVFPYDLNEDAILNDQPWIIEDPFDPDSFTYTDARYEASKAPAFPDGAALTVGTVTENRATLTFPVIEAADTVVKYHIRAYDAQGALRRSTTVNAPVHKYKKPETLSATLEKLRDDTAYRIEVTAINTYGKESAPLTTTLHTPAYTGPQKAAAAFVGLDADGKVISENGLTVTHSTPTANPSYLTITQRNGVYGYQPQNVFSLYVAADPDVLDLNADAYKVTIRYFDGASGVVNFQYKKDSIGANTTTYFVLTNTQTWKTVDILLDDVNLSLPAPGDIFAFYASSFDPEDVCIADIRLETTTLPDPAPDGSSLWVINPDDGPVFGSGVPDTTHVLFGQYAGKLDPAAGGLMALSHSFSTPRDLSGYSRFGYLHLNLYIEDASAFKSHAYLELSSSGRCDVDEREYSFAGTLTDGWNHICMPLKNGTAAGSIDWTAVNFARLVLQNDDGSPVWIDGVYVSMSEENLAPSSRTLTDAATGMSVSGFFPEGTTLTTTPLDASHPDYAAFKEAAGKELLLCVDPRLSKDGQPPAAGSLTLTFTGLERFNGRSLVFLWKNGEQIETALLPVADGQATVQMQVLTPCALSLPDDPGTGRTPLGLWIALTLGIAVLGIGFLAVKKRIRPSGYYGRSR